MPRTSDSGMVRRRRTRQKGNSVLKKQKKSADQILSPTPDQLKRLRAKHGLTQFQAAEFVCTTSRRWYRWESLTEYRPMPRALFLLFLIRIGEAKVHYLDADLAELS